MFHLVVPAMFTQKKHFSALHLSSAGQQPCIYWCRAEKDLSSDTIDTFALLSILTLLMMPPMQSAGHKITALSNSHLSMNFQQQSCLFFHDFKKWNLLLKCTWNTGTGLEMKWTFAMTLTLTTANQYFHWTLWLMMFYHQTKFGCKRIGSEAIAEAVMFWL